MNVLTAEQQPLYVSRNRSRDTKSEALLGHSLWKERRQYCVGSKLMGKSDAAFLRSKVVVFLDRCSWHGLAEHGG